MTEKPVAHDKAVIGLVSAAHFFSHFFFLVLPPLFPLLKQEFGVSYTALGGITAVYGTCSAISQYPIGVLVDKYGSRAFLIGGMSVICLVFIAMGFVNSIAALYLLAMVAGLADGVFHPCDYSILSMTVKKETAGRAYSIHTFGGFAGFGVAPLVTVPLASLFGWQNAVFAVGLMGLVFCLAMVANRGKLTSRRKDEFDGGPAPQRTSVVKIMTTVPLLAMLGFYAFSSIANVGVTTHVISILMETKELSFEALSMVLPGYLWGIIAGILAGGFAADFFGRLDLTATLGTATSGLMLLVVALVELPLGLIVVTFFVSGFGYGSTMGSRDLVVRAVSPAGSIAQAFAFVNIGYGVGSAVGPVLIGWILDKGLVQAALIVPAVLLFVSMTFTLGAVKMRPAGGDRKPVVP